MLVSWEGNWKRRRGKIESAVFCGVFLNVFILHVSTVKYEILVTMMYPVSYHATALVVLFFLLVDGVFLFYGGATTTELRFLLLFFAASSLLLHTIFSIV